MEDQTLHHRLETLGHKIDRVEARLREEAHQRHDTAHLTAKELKARYVVLQARLNREAAEAEAHGHHVSNLERSVEQWLDSFDNAHAASD